MELMTRLTRNSTVEGVNFCPARNEWSRSAVVKRLQHSVGAAFVTTTRYVNKCEGIIFTLWQSIPCRSGFISAKLPRAAAGGAQLIVTVAKGAACGPFPTVLAKLQRDCTPLAT